MDRWEANQHIAAAERRIEEQEGRVCSLQGVSSLDLTRAERLLETMRETLVRMRQFRKSLN